MVFLALGKSLHKGMLVALASSFVLSLMLLPANAGDAPAARQSAGADPAATSVDQYPRTAQAAIADAEAAVRRARQQDALWTTAVEALEAARSAFSREDYEQAIRAARLAREQACMGIAQRSYPDFEWLIEDQP